VQLPFVIEFEPPSRADLVCLLGGGRRRWLVAGLVLALAAIAGSWWMVRSVGAGSGSPGATPSLDLNVTSRPAGARITLDGRELGRTPASLAVAPGLHDLGLLAPDAPEARYRLQVDHALRFDAILWRRDAVVARLRPALPGAALTSVDLLDDGRLALGVAVPPQADLQAWLFDPVSGALERVALGSARGRLAVAADGGRVAALASNGAADPPSEVWVWPTRPSTEAAGVVWRLDAGSRAHLTDLTWSPQAADQRLLVVSAEDLFSGGQRSQLWQLDLAPGAVEAGPRGARQLISLPSTVVPGSFVWSPDGQRVVFLARAGSQRALCALDLPDGAFRYLADLDTSETSGSRLPFPPVAWRAGGHDLLFVARSQDPPSNAITWFERPRRLVYRVDDDLVARPIGPTDADVVAWREDGASLVLLGRVKDDGPLVLRAADAALGQLSQLMELPLRPPAYAARWDVPHARLLLASPAAGLSDAPDFTLVRLGEDD
jgi:PEGA domain